MPCACVAGLTDRAADTVQEPELTRKVNPLLAGACSTLTLLDDLMRRWLLDAPECARGQLVPVPRAGQLGGYL